MRTECDITKSCMAFPPQAQTTSCSFEIPAIRCSRSGRHYFIAGYPGRLLHRLRVSRESNAGTVVASLVLSRNSSAGPCKCN
ncbi:uncharacterized protein BDZ83DRAFT_604408 [Colletotrichum acutatum]|uniref:Uncharacterized protein n=1 Tax=Glomerella acutata TaxID=27357 RepID=A0AAD8XLM5_GLOAC|nr:uncharacterized protein BDZ83DRAFT_604408 [Colletotrichum acutatum]KAK1729612.1 hypothetical protein BDZ83DRAFT_604408 [Colletotrichum acutatum]